MATAAHAEPLPPPRTIGPDDARHARTWAGYLEHLRWIAGHGPMVRELAASQLQLTVSRSRLYYLWWLLDPVLDTACYALLFLVVARGGAVAEGSPPLIAFLLAGLIPWRLCASSWQIAAGLWQNNKGLLDQIRFPVLALMIARFATEAWLYGIALVVLVAACVLSGVAPAWTWLLLPVWVVLHALLVIAVMPLFAAMTAYSVDLLKLLPYALRLAFFGAPVLYSIPDGWPGWAKQILWLNPLTPLVTGYRDLLLYARLPSTTTLIVFPLVVAVLLLLSTRLFVALERNMIRNVARLY